MITSEMSKNVVKGNEKKCRRGKRGKRTDASMDACNSLVSLQISTDKPKAAAVDALRVNMEACINAMHNLEVSPNKRQVIKLAKNANRRIVKIESMDPKSAKTPTTKSSSQRKQMKQKTVRSDNNKTANKSKKYLTKEVSVSASTKKQDKKKFVKKSLPVLKTKHTFPGHIPASKMNEILINQKSDDYIKGYFRVNPRYHKHGYVCISSEESDLLIIGLRNRNRAFDGDLVVAKVNPMEEWPTLNGKIQKTGTIVCILEKIHSRKAVGCLKAQGSVFFLQPRDFRIPLVKIDCQATTLPPDSETMASSKTLFLVDILRWDKPQFAIGRLTQIIGTAGDLKSELDAILLGNELDVTPYKDKLLMNLPNDNYVLTRADMKNREDWRSACIFTIDPATAVDLDDAVSCRVLKNGNYEIGVHIADVTHFLKFSSPLDIEVGKRATTVYMPNKAYHMLPKQLCQVCSLLPGQDKLAFSVILELTPDARVAKHRFAKTIINSCCQLSYDTAQMIIENPKKDWPIDTIPMYGTYIPNQLAEIINNLYKLSVQMRERRYANGALKINQLKLRVTVNSESGLPESWYIEEQRESNSLIEEFMLLANITVATHLYKTVPEFALLRSHKEPSERILTDIQNLLQTFGLHLNIESAGSLHTSLERYGIVSAHETNSVKAVVAFRMMVINNFCSKAMVRATYKCSSSVRSKDDLRHYSLNVPCYTHFTSPIRRYADCVVHRLLYAVLQKSSLPKNWNSVLCTNIAVNCNKKKYCAKTAEEQSTELYFTHWLSISGPILTNAIVLGIREHSVDVILCYVGIKLKINLALMENRAVIQYCGDEPAAFLTVTWKKPAITQVISIFTILHVKVKKHKDVSRLTGTIVLPKD